MKQFDYILLFIFIISLIIITLGFVIIVIDTIKFHDDEVHKCFEDKAKKLCKEEGLKLCKEKGLFSARIIFVGNYYYYCEKYTHAVDAIQFKFTEKEVKKCLSQK